MADLQPIVLARQTVTGSAIAHLRRQIVEGLLPSGEPLPEGKVGQLLGVSRAPVREALAVLEREGLVTFDRRGTARVCEFGPDEIRELEVMRSALEPIAAGKACERRPDEQFAALRENLAATRSAEAGPAITQLDIEFHRLVCQAAGNKRLLWAWEGMASQLWLVMARHHALVQRQTGCVKGATHREHLKLFQALEGGNPLVAEALAREHTKGWLLELEQLARPGANPGAPS